MFIMNLKTKIFIILFLFLFFIIMLLFISLYSKNQNNLMYNKPIIYDFNYILDYNVFLIDPSIDIITNNIYEEQILDLIKNSKESIYCSVYNITLESISNELINQKNNNLDIKIITDLKQTSNRNSKIGVLKANNIPIYNNIETTKSMHNKYCVFDNNIVLFGSTNFTYDSLYKHNNDFIIINNKEVSKIFIDQFNLFLNSNNNYYYYNSNDNNNYNNSYNYNKVIDYNYLDSSLYKFYFCNSKTNNCELQIINLFRNSTKSIKCMQYSFTYNNIYLELKELLDLNKDIELKFITEKTQNSKYSLYTKIKDLSIDYNKEFIILDKNPSFMHNKFCIFNNDILLTGSANLTNNGLTNNFESILITKDKNIIDKFNIYFDKYFHIWK
jgi:phosphatidylserine/phosphatidylglycerophosphate/cardiolipin synthase-like enzyme